MAGKKGNRIMKERAKQAQARAQLKLTPISTNNETVQNIPDDFNVHGGHAGVVALSDISLTLLALLPPTVIGALSFRMLRNADMNVAPALLISGGLAWMGYRIAEPLVFEGVDRPRLRD